MTYWENKVVVISGGSAGLGLHLAQTLVQKRARVVLIARDQARLQQVSEELGGQAFPLAADITNDDQVEHLRQKIEDEFGRVDALFNCVGKSARGAILETTPDDFQELFELNFLSVVRCTLAFVPMLKQSQGHIINIGSLASKSASRYLGAYPASKFPVAAYTQQLRLALSETHSAKRVHVLLVCPGPIARPDAGARYQGTNVPANARQPGGGVKLKGIDPMLLSKKILRACEKRQLELIVPAKARILFIVAQISPRIGDWLVTKMTGKT